MPGSTSNSCRLAKSFWLGRIRLFHRGHEIVRSKEAGKPFLIQLPEARTTRVVIKHNGLDYLPKVEIDG